MTGMVAPGAHVACATRSGRVGLTPRDVVVYRRPVDNLELISQLIRLGLTSYEARAYAALVRRDSFSAAQVARQSGLPRQRIYDVLETLVQKGLASSRPGPHAKYAAVAPEVAVERLLAARRAELSAIELDGAAVVEELTPA